MNPILKKLLLQVVNVVYTQGLYPLAKNYVESTSNNYDDKALEFLNDLVKDLLKKL
jgi:hypothetical protein